MSERHTYQSKPEPGFQVRMEERVLSYCTHSPDSDRLSVQLSKILKDHPEMVINFKFLDKIFQTAATLNERNKSEK